jgi:sulfite reductase alpha subunit-like flavoprotein
MTTQNIKEIEITLQQLQDCYLTALMRVYPELHKELPLLKRREYSLKNSPEMNENQLKVTQAIIANRLVLMAENIGEFDNALKELDKNYYGKYMNVNYDNSSDLSTILKKVD